MFILLMMTRVLKTILLVFVILVMMPTLLFLIKNYYTTLMSKRTYIGVIELPLSIERSEDILSAAKTLFNAAQIKAIVIKIDGFGGAPGVCQALYEDLIFLKKTYQKPLLAYGERFCARGSYLIGTAADAIIVNATTRLEGLGLFEKDEKSEGEWEANQTSEYWRLVRAARPGLVDTSFSSDMFLTGREARDKGLIDYLGSSCEVERVIRSHILVEGRIEVVRGSLLEHFVLSLTSVLTPVIKAIRAAWYPT